MKKALLPTLGLCLTLAACATMPAAPIGLEAGRFVSFDCSGTDFSARYSPDGNTVRIRSHHGAAELTESGDTWSGDGYVLVLKGASGISLSLNGKVLGSQCKRI